MSCRRIMRAVANLSLGLLAALLPVLLPQASAIAAELEIPGSGNPEYILTELARAFNAAQTQHRVVIPPSTGTAGAIRALEEKTATLARVGRMLKEEELRKGLSFIPLGRDPVVFVGGAGVTASGLTQAQALDIYAGKITDWKALGGKPAPIRAIGREVTDASRSALGRHIKDFGTMNFPESIKLAHLDPQALQLLDRYPTSLAFLNRSALSAARTKLVPLALDQVPGTQQNVATGKYPVWLDLGLIHRSGTLPSPAKEFVDFVGSPAGTAILRQHGILAAAR